MKIAITGSKGIIGSNLVPYLESKGHEVVQILSDIRDYAALREEFSIHSNIDWLVHLAAIVSTISCDLAGRHTFDVNVKGTYNVADLCKENKIKFCYFSTTAIYKPGQNPILEESIKEPQTLYGYTKYLGELTAQNVFKDKPEDLLLLRPCFAFGGNNDRSIGSLVIKSGIHNEPINVQLDPEKLKDYMHVDNLSEAVEMLLIRNITGEYNISYGEPIKFGDLVKKVEAMGLKPFIYYRPELDYMGDHVVNNTKLKSVIDWKPSISVEEGLKKVFEKLTK
ncbi:MAG: NAD(P)-dependent oxidoreductase [Methanogenium sp.]|jgi:nucleoside-diphosphate-sugar epimerase